MQNQSLLEVIMLWELSPHIPFIGKIVNIGNGSDGDFEKEEEV